MQLSVNTDYFFVFENAKLVTSSFKQQLWDAVSSKVALSEFSLKNYIIDRDNPDYTKAEAAMNNISDLLPDIIKGIQINIDHILE